MEKKKMYKCALCDQEHETVAERAKCEMACIDKQLAIEENAKQEKAKQEQETERQKVVAALNHAGELLDAYTDKYGSFSYSVSVPCDSNTISVSNYTDSNATTTKSTLETKSKEPWPFDSWPLTSKLFSYFW